MSRAGLFYAKQLVAAALEVHLERQLADSRIQRRGDRAKVALGLTGAQLGHVASTRSVVEVRVE